MTTKALLVAFKYSEELTREGQISFAIIIEVFLYKRKIITVEMMDEIIKLHKKYYA